MIKGFGDLLLAFAANSGCDAISHVCKGGTQRQPEPRSLENTLTPWISSHWRQARPRPRRHRHPIHLAFRIVEALTHTVEKFR
jgi:hypothetical protein